MTTDKCPLKKDSSIKFQFFLLIPALCDPIPQAINSDKDLLSTLVLRYPALESFQRNKSN